MKTILITGASSGIGRATARLLAGYGHRLILCARRMDRLEELAVELAALGTESHLLSFDVRNEPAVTEAISTLPEEWRAIDVLINNAGNAHGLAPIHEYSLADADAMMDINVKGLLYVSAAVLPGMVHRRRGQVINISSIAGRSVYPNGAVYCASKAAVDAITQGMRMDLNPYGIRVSSVAPGMVETDFSLVRFKGDEARAKAVYQDYEPLQPEDIADFIAYVVQAPPNVVIADALILPLSQAAPSVVNKTGRQQA